MNLITRIAAYWRKHFMSTDATSCANQNPCPECVVVSLDNPHMHIDWCQRCGENIFRVPKATVWYNRDGKATCPAQPLLAHAPLLSAEDISMPTHIAIMVEP